MAQIMKLVGIAGPAIETAAPRKAANNTQPSFPKVLADAGTTEDDWAWEPDFNGMVNDAYSKWGNIAGTVYLSAGKGKGYWYNDGVDPDTGKKWSKTKLPASIKIVTKAEAKEARQNMLLEDFPEADKVVSKLNAKVGASLTLDDFIAWYEGEGSFAQIKRFDSAVTKLVGAKARDVAESSSRLYPLVQYVLGLGPDNVGGFSMKAILDKFPLSDKKGTTIAEIDKGLSGAVKSKIANKALANKTIRTKDGNIVHDENGIPNLASLRKMTVPQLLRYMEKNSKVTKSQLVALLRGE